MGAKVIILAKSLIPNFLRACAIVHCVTKFDDHIQWPCMITTCRLKLFQFNLADLSRICILVSTNRTGLISKENACPQSTLMIPTEQLLVLEYTASMFFLLQFSRNLAEVFETLSSLPISRKKQCTICVEHCWWSQDWSQSPRFKSKTAYILQCIKKF